MTSSERSSSSGSWPSASAIVAWTRPGTTQFEETPASEGALWLAYHGPLVRVDLASSVTVLDARRGLRGSARSLLEYDGKLWITSGERQQFTPAQDMKSNLGKVVRLNDDGSVPADNPFYAQGGVTAQIWSLGHRNLLGIAFAPDGRLYAHEMGPRGGDELNIIEKGANYGTPSSRTAITTTAATFPIIRRGPSSRRRSSPGTRSSHRPASSGSFASSSMSPTLGHPRQGSWPTLALDISCPSSSQTGSRT